MFLWLLFCFFSQATFGLRLSGLGGFLEVQLAPFSFFWKLGGFSLGFWVNRLLKAVSWLSSSFLVFL